MFLESSTNQCEKCHALCNDCSASSNSECVSGCSNLGKDVEKKSSLCVIDCSPLGNYYQELKSCKLCNETCETCTYKTSKDCIKCADYSKVQYRGECLDKCPTHYFPFDRICYKCHDSCENCTNGTNKGCLSCYDGYVLWQNQCLVYCPRFTFKLKKTCEYCYPPCLECISEDQCLSCVDKYYFVDKTLSCVVKENCPDGTYGDDDTRSCMPCHISCATCKGKTSKDCKLCNFRQGYAKSEKDKDECLELMCKEGTFRYIDISKSLAWCAPCYFTCKTCDDFGGHNCITCGRKFRALPSNVTGRTLCQSCKDANSGYTESENEELGCVEICGDGKNLGQYECDDGNNKDGDGCSSQCSVEEGFMCKTHDRSRPDVCYDIKPPYGTAKVQPGQIIELTFDENIVAGYDSNTMDSYMNVWVEGADSDCGLQWSYKDKFKKKQILNKIYLKVSVICSLKGSESYVIQINNTEAIKDLSNNAYPTAILIRAPSMRFVYVSPATKDIMSGSGAAFTASAAITFGFLFGCSMLQSVAIGSFWSFVNMLQLVSYLPVINVEIPQNFQMFADKFLTISKVSIPFYIFPAWFPSPSMITNNFITKPFSEKFAQIGFPSLSFFGNFADQLGTWFVLFLIYLLLRFLNNIIPKGRFTFIKQWKEDYEYNGVLRMMIESFMQLSVSSILNIWNLGYSTPVQIISLAGASVGLYLAVCFIIICSIICETPAAEMRKTVFAKKFGTLIEELRVESYGAKIFWPLYLIRRIYSAIIIVVLIKYPLVQLFAFSFVFTMPMIIYLLIVRPFETSITNFLNLFNELFLFILYFSIFLLNSFNSSIAFKEGVGWFLVVCIFMTLILTWVFILPKAIINAYSSGKNWIKEHCFSHGSESSINTQNALSIPQITNSAMTKQHDECNLRSSQNCTNAEFENEKMEKKKEEPEKKPYSKPMVFMKIKKNVLPKSETQPDNRIFTTQAIAEKTTTQALEAEAPSVPDPSSPQKVDASVRFLNIENSQASFEFLNNNRGSIVSNKTAQDIVISQERLPSVNDVDVADEEKYDQKSRKVSEDEKKRFRGSFDSKAEINISRKNTKEGNFVFIKKNNKT